MSVGAVYSNVVKLGLTPELRVLLDDYIKNSLTIPIILFKTTTIENAILLAVDYLREKKEGVVEIPADDNHPWVRLVSSRNSIGEVRINFITTNYRYPTVENRPYTNDPWEMGDIIISNDINSSKCLGWGCLVGGSPGTWEQFGHLKRWYSQLEQVDSLPDPSELQANRQVIYCDPESTDPDVYYCALVPSTGQWTWLKMTIFEEDVSKLIKELYQAELKNYVTTAVENEIAEYFKENPIDASDAVREYFIQNPINVQNEVENYLADNPITSTIDLTLRADSWSGDAAPYQQLLSHDSLLINNTGIANVSQSATSDQWDCAASARMIVKSQEGSSLTIYAYGQKPSIDIPITITLINNR